MARRRTRYLASPLTPLSLCGTTTQLWKTRALIKQMLVTQLLYPMGRLVSLVMSKVLKRKIKK
jgi:Fe2+ transport system protein B